MEQVLVGNFKSPKCLLNKYLHLLTRPGKWATGALPQLSQSNTISFSVHDIFLAYAFGIKVNYKTQKAFFSCLKKKKSKTNQTTTTKAHKEHFSVAFSDLEVLNFNLLVIQHIKNKRTVAGRHCWCLGEEILSHRVL